MTATESVVMTTDSQSVKGWHMTLCEYHAEIFEAMEERVIEVLSRAYYRIYNLPDIAELDNVLFLFALSNDPEHPTAVTNVKPYDSSLALLVNGVLMGAWSALELEYEERFPTEEEE